MVNYFYVIVTLFQNLDSKTHKTERGIQKTNRVNRHKNPPEPIFVPQVREKTKRRRIQVLILIFFNSAQGHLTYVRILI